MIELYTSPTPNCQKVAIFLEEAGLAYQTHEISLGAGQHREPAYREVNPNTKVPAIIDQDLDCTVWESGAILIHLAEKTGKFLPQDPSARAHVIQWLMLQMSGLGPAQGGANVYSRYVSEKIDWLIERHRRETRRIYSLLNEQLQHQEYLAGDYSIADMAFYPWVRFHFWAGIDLEDFKYLQAWVERVAVRTAVARTRDYYEPDMSEYMDKDLTEMVKNVMN